MSATPTTNESLESRVSRLERTISNLQIVVTICILVIAILLLDHMFPGLAGLLLFILIILAIPAAVIMFISVIMGLLDWLTARGRSDDASPSP
jgi:hypothetical protein